MLQSVRIGQRSELFLILILMALTGFVKPQTSYPVNEDVIADLLVKSTLEKLKTNLPEAEAITIYAASGNQFESWFQQILTDSCLQHNYLVYSYPKKDSADAILLEISGTAVEINYKSTGRKWLFGSKGFQRIIASKSHLQFRNKENQVLFSQEISGEYQDVIPGNFLKSAENEALPFTKGTKSADPFIKRWLEPVIITASTMTVGYLFYTLRSE